MGAWALIQCCLLLPPPEMEPVALLLLVLRGSCSAASCATVASLQNLPVLRLLRITLPPALMDVVFVMADGLYTMSFSVFEVSLPALANT